MKLRHNHGWIYFLTATFLFSLSCSHQTQVGEENLFTRMDGMGRETNAPPMAAAPAPKAVQPPPADAGEEQPQQELVSAGVADKKARVKPRQAKLPPTPLNKNGKLLNRYYFMRLSDSPEKLAQRIYGAPDRRKDILEWNGPAEYWSPGRMLFYISPKQPDDKKMKSFYEENQIPVKEHTVLKGDWVSLIAQNRYGHPGSWVEIAVLNEMNDPDRLEVGQKIKVYPADFSQVAHAPASQQVPTPQVAAARVEDSAASAELPTPQLASGESTGSFFMRLPWSITVGAGLFFILFFLIRRKKEKRL